MVCFVSVFIHASLPRSVEDQAVKLDLENMNMLLRNMPLRVDAEEVTVH